MEEQRAAKGLSEYNEIYKENDQVYRTAARRCGMPESAFWILYIMRCETGPLTLRRLCGILCLPKQTIHSALKSLEADGLIGFHSGGDRRTKLLHLTAPGEQRARETVDCVVAAEQRAMQALSEAEQSEFLRLFRRYTQALKEEIGGEP